MQLFLNLTVQHAVLALLFHVQFLVNWTEVMMLIKCPIGMPGGEEVILESALLNQKICEPPD